MLKTVYECVEELSLINNCKKLVFDLDKYFRESNKRQYDLSEIYAKNNCESDLESIRIVLSDFEEFIRQLKTVDIGDDV